MWLKLTCNFLICGSRNCRFRKMKRADSVNRGFTQWNAWLLTSKIFINRASDVTTVAVN